MSSYWQKRFELLEEKRNQIAKQTVQSVTPAFDKAQAQIEKEINAWYGRFAKNNEISLQEAKKLLNSKELKEFKWDVEEYIKYGRQNALDQKWMKELENASARFHISRLEALKIRTQNAAEQAFGNELDALDEMAARIYTDDYYHSAYEIQKGLGIGWDVGQIDDRKLKDVLTKPWTADKQTFSDRIWKSKTQLLDSLQTELTQMCILGKDPQQSIDFIAKRMNVSKGQAGRLIMTEAAYFSSVAQKDCFNDLDVEMYEIVATLDSHTSDVCQHMDGKVFKMSDFQAGVTAPPFHVWCRSCTVPYFEDNNDGTRAARGEDGKTYQVPASMKYEDWKEYFVDKTKDPADWLKVASADDIVDAVEKFVPAKTIEEAETFAKQSGVKYVDYGKLPLDTANEINKALNTLPDDVRPVFVGDSSMLEKYWGGKLPRSSKQYYGVTIDTFDGIHLGAGNGIDFDTNGQMVGISYSYRTADKITVAKKAAQTRYMEKHDGRTWFFNVSGETTPFHEMGHVYERAKGIPNGFEFAARKWSTEAKCDMISKPSEAWAEAWASYHTGVNIDKVPEYVLEFIKKAVDG